MAALLESQPMPDLPPGDDLATLLPAVEPAAREALNAWLAQRGAPVFRIGAHEIELRWQAESAVRWHVAVELVAGTHRALLALDSFAAIDPLMVGEPFALLPAAIRDLVVQRLAARVFAGAPRAMAESIEVRAIEWQAGALPGWPCRLFFGMRRRPDGGQALGALLFETAAALKWLHAILPVDGASAFRRRSLPVPMRLMLGRTSVRTDELIGLAEGDVVWIASGGVTREGVAVELSMPNGRCMWRCRAKHRALRLVAAGEGGGSDASPATEAARVNIGGIAGMNADRWQLEVPVTFDLGELRVELGQLERLEPGQVLELPHDVAMATVRLKVAERAIAEGTLIAVGRRLGVRIGRVLAEPEAPGSPAGAGHG